MSENATPAEVAIHVRARFQDRHLIDQGAALDAEATPTEIVGMMRLLQAASQAE